MATASRATTLAQASAAGWPRRPFTAAPAMAAKYATPRSVAMRGTAAFGSAGGGSMDMQIAATTGPTSAANHRQPGARARSITGRGADVAANRRGTTGTGVESVISIVLRASMSVSVRRHQRAMSSAALTSESRTILVPVEI